MRSCLNTIYTIIKHDSFRDICNLQVKNDLNLNHPYNEKVYIDNAKSQKILQKAKFITVLAAGFLDRSVADQELPHIRSVHYGKTCVLLTDTIQLEAKTDDRLKIRNKTA